MIAAINNEDMYKIVDKEDILRIYEVKGEQDYLSDCKIMHIAEETFIFWKTKDCMKIKTIFLTFINDQLSFNFVEIENPSLRRITCFGINSIEP